MTETRFTPGPWRRQTGSNIGNAVEGFSHVCDEYDAGYRTVALFQAAIPTPKYDDLEANAEANGNLIAAAPELYEALEAALELEALIVERMTCPDESQRRSCQSEIDGTTEMIRAALAKARGETE